MDVSHIQPSLSDCTLNTSRSIPQSSSHSPLLSNCLSFLYPTPSYSLPHFLSSAVARTTGKAWGECNPKISSSDLPRRSSPSHTWMLSRPHVLTTPHAITPFKHTNTLSCTNMHLVWLAGWRQPRAERKRVQSMSIDMQYCTKTATAQTSRERDQGEKVQWERESIFIPGLCVVHSHEQSLCGRMQNFKSVENNKCSLKIWK